MLVDLEAPRLIHDRGHFDRRLAAHEPGSKRCAIAEIVEQTAAAGGLLVPPRRRLLTAHVVLRNHDLVGAMIKRSSVAVIEMNLDHVADRALLDKAFGRDMR